MPGGKSSIEHIRFFKTKTRDLPVGLDGIICTSDLQGVLTGAITPDDSMNSLPILTTNQLVLRPFTLADAQTVQHLAGDRDVASTTLRIPHPYKDGMAEEWIGTHADKCAKGEGISLAVSLRDAGTLVGAVGLEICKEHSRAELGYWIGKPYWGKGFATEAAKALVEYGFQVVGLNRIYAYHVVRNPASGRVMHKIGMHHAVVEFSHPK